MPKPPKPVSPEEAGSYFEAMLSSGEFRGSEMYGPVLRILFESWKVDQDATLSEDDLIIKLGAKLTIDEKSFRPTIGRLRLKVSDYGNKSKQPIKFEIPKGTRYQLQ